jgi:hypothetical protein
VAEINVSILGLIKLKHPIAHRRVIIVGLLPVEIKGALTMFRVGHTQCCAVLALLVVVCGGCGYKSRSDLLGHIDSITVAPLANETVEYGLEDDLANALRQDFSRHWGEGTNSMFTGAIKIYEILPISWDQNNQPEQYRIIMEMAFVFEDLKRNKVVRNEKNYEKTYDFYVVSDRGEPPETLKDARQKLIDEIAKDIVSSIVEQW